MSKKPIIGGIILAAIIGVVFVGAQINPDNPENEKSPNLEVWSIRMAGSEWTNSCDTYTSYDESNLELWGKCSVTELNDDSQTHRAWLKHSTKDVPYLEEGIYKFGFVPMGDSPDKIRISIETPFVERLDPSESWRVLFSEEFILKGTLVDTGISKYYTWEYVDQHGLSAEEYDVYIPEGSWEISITRTGNLEGSVTISLSR